MFRRTTSPSVEDISTQELDNFTMTTLSGSGGGGTASSTTIYPNQYYSVEDTTPTKYIWAGDALVATVEGTGTTTTNYIHTDHLGSTNVVTDEGETGSIKAYLAHLFRSQEMLGAHLASIHNLYTIVQYTKNLRDSILRT